MSKQNMTRTSNSSTRGRVVAKLEEAVKKQTKRKFLNAETHLRQVLGATEFDELKDLLRSDKFQLSAVQRVLKDRGADVNYASLHRLREKWRSES